MKRNSFKLALGFLIFLALVAIFAPVLATHDPKAISLPDELCFPSRAHFLGCDSFGSDIFSLLLFGSRLSLGIACLVTLFNVLLALIIGSAAGYLGGNWDSFLMRLVDLVFAFPGLLLAIAIAGMLGPSTLNLILALTVTGWAGYTRIIRAEILALKQKEYIEAARALGLSSIQIITRHIWPNLAPRLAIAASFGLGHVVMAEASLSFLGIGVPPGTPSWGSLLNYGKDVLIEAPHVALVPGIALLAVVLCFNLLGEALRDHFDPRHKLLP